VIVADRQGFRKAASEHAAAEDFIAAAQARIVVTKPKPTTDLYFEAHITISPIGDDYVLRSRVEDLGRSLGFRMATFLLKKDDQDQPDDFFSSRSHDYELIEYQVEMMVRYLNEYGVKVKRYKIENTLLDVKL
jgi:hypothetical protein